MALPTYQLAIFGTVGPMRRASRGIILGLFALCLSGCLFAEGVSSSDSGNEPDAFTFVRIRYESTGGYGESWYRYEGRDWERWETDYPRAEKNLIFRLRQLTTFRVNAEPITLRLTDERLANYPFIFMSDVGWMKLSEKEKSALRRYLANGGFLWVDDFWGRAE